MCAQILVITQVDTGECIYKDSACTCEGAVKVHARNYLRLAGQSMRHHPMESAALCTGLGFILAGGKQRFPVKRGTC